MSVERPYQVCLYVGPHTPTIDGVRVVNLTPAEDTHQAVVDALRGAELTPADLRSRVLFVSDGDVSYQARTLMTYAALLGFAKRRLDVAFAVDGEATAMDTFDASLRQMPGIARPEVIPDTIQVGGAARTDITHVDVTAGLNLQSASLIRFSRRLRFVPPASTAAAVQMLVAIAALRARGAVDKFPLLCDGTEDAPVPGAVDAAGVCLDTLRRAGEEVRRDLRSDNRAALADRVEDPAFDRLRAADAVAVETVLTRLGAKSKIVDLPAKPGTPEHAEGLVIPTEVWHCPRPARHTNGDANPSSRVVVKGDQAYFQCFRCDPERVGPLRLVMDTLSMTGAEAADWILG